MTLSRTPVSDLVQAARQRADLENSAFISNDEALSMANASAKELYDLLVGAFEMYRATSVSFTVPTGSVYSLPDDFYKALGVDLSLGDQFVALRPFNFLHRNRKFPPYFWSMAPVAVGQFQYRFVDDEVRFIPETLVAGQTFRLWYTPRFADMAYGTPASASFQDITYTALASGSAGNSLSLAYVSGGVAGSETVAVSGSAVIVSIESGSTRAHNIVAAVNADPYSAPLVIARAVRTTTLQGLQAQTFLSGGVDDSTLDGVSGWDEYVVVDVAMKMLVKEESDTSALMNAKLMLKQRIEEMAVNRDTGMTPTVTDVYGLNSRYGWHINGVDY